MQTVRLTPTMASADFSQFVVTTAFLPPVRPHGISHQSFLVYLPDLRLWVTVAFGTSLPYASLSAIGALYQVSVRQATILLSLLLACTSRYKPWESLRGSSATTPRVDFHHRLTACPSYIKKARLGGRRAGNTGPESDAFGAICWKWMNITAPGKAMHFPSPRHITGLVLFCLDPNLFSFPLP